MDVAEDRATYLQRSEKHLIDTVGMTPRMWETAKEQLIAAGWVYQPDVLVFTKSPVDVPGEENPS